MLLEKFFHAFGKSVTGADRPADNPSAVTGLAAHFSSFHTSHSTKSTNEITH